MPPHRDTFAARTHHHRDFDAARLVERKRHTATSVSVVIPAKDEEPTVGNVVATLGSTLMGAVPLIDELVVVDASSNDRTAEVARAAGGRVVSQSAVLPGAGDRAGKGEALWKGLAATTGDVVVFIDADIRDIGPRFVVGLVGPLLLDPSVRFTKAAYDRPLMTADGQLEPSGGGRVTELLARPLIAAFWPELAWLAQPLSGEYAGRRDLLESLPFVQGYGVELALLVDILERHGADAMAQVDLGRRIHDHQPLESLSRMAAEILHVAIDRLTRHDRLVLSEPLATALLQPWRDDGGRLDLAVHDVTPSERPPLATWRKRDQAADGGEVADADGPSAASTGEAAGADGSRPEGELPTTRSAPRYGA